MELSNVLESLNKIMMLCNFNRLADKTDLLEIFAAKIPHVTFSSFVCVFIYI